MQIDVLQWNDKGRRIIRHIATKTFVIKQSYKKKVHWQQNYGFSSYQRQKNGFTFDVLFDMINREK